MSLTEEKRAQRRKNLLKLIDDKLAQAKAKPKANPKPRRSTKPATRAAVNRKNAKNSTGPRTAQGKAASSSNSLKQGFFANVENLYPQDAPTFINLLSDLRQGLHPDGPVEDLLVRELATLQARLQRLEAIEYALLMGNIEAPPLPGDCLVCPKLDPQSAQGQRRRSQAPAPSCAIKIEAPCGQTGLSPTSSNQMDIYLRDPFNNNAPLDFSFDSRDLAQAFITAFPHLDSLHRAETHLRRAYNRTFDRLQRMQKDRLKAPQPAHLVEISSKRTQSPQNNSNQIRNQQDPLPHAAPKSRRFERDSLLPIWNKEDSNHALDPTATNDDNSPTEL